LRSCDAVSTHEERPVEKSVDASGSYDAFGSP
jgi:hypothetical protein